MSGLEIPSNISGLVHKHYDRLLADDSLTEIDVLLLAIYLIENKNKVSGAKYDEAKELFVSLGRKEDRFRKVVYNARGGSLIEERGGALHFLIKGLKRFRQVSGQIEKARVYVIRSGESFSAIKLLEEFLSTEITSDEVLLCDPHVSPSTLFPFSILKARVKSIRILTSNIYDSDKFDEYEKKMKKETGITIEVKISRKVHDRYLINGEKCWSVGSSIKDLGNKDSIIKEISEVTASMRELFLERWNEPS